MGGDPVSSELSPQIESLPGPRRLPTNAPEGGRVGGVCQGAPGSQVTSLKASPRVPAQAQHFSPTPNLTGAGERGAGCELKREEERGR